MVNNWTATAFNQVPDAENEIDGDKVAKQYGFKGCLVPGATVAAYLTHPFVEAFGVAFLETGCAHVRLNSALYDGDGDGFRVEIEEGEGSAFSARLVQSEAAPCALAEVDVGRNSKSPPVVREDDLGDREARLMMATPDSMRQLQEDGCKAFTDRWSADHQMNAYLRDSSQRAGSFADGAYANPSFIIGMSNWVLAANAHMYPWVLVETRSQNFAPIADGSRVLGEMTIVDLFNRKGHEFVDADFNLFDAERGACFSTVQLRAIYRLRGC